MASYGLSYSLLGPAQSALLTVMLPSELLPAANGVLHTIQQGLRLLGPVAGAGLFVVVGAHVIAIFDAATFAVAVVSLLLLRVREPAPLPVARRWRSELTAGIRHIRSTVELRQVVIAGAISTTVFGFAETITYAVAGAGLHQRPAFVGILVAVQGIGAVIGGPTAAALVRSLGEHRLVAVGLLTAAAAAVLELPPAMVPVIAGFILFGMAIPWIVIALITLTQRLTPSEIQGRTYSAADMLITTPQTISIALGAALIAVTGYRPLLIAMAGTMAFASAYLFTRSKPGHGMSRPDRDGPTKARLAPSDSR
jgi:MFS family permease